MAMTDPEFGRSTILTRVATARGGSLEQIVWITIRYTQIVSVTMWFSRRANIILLTT